MIFRKGGSAYILMLAVAALSSTWVWGQERTHTVQSGETFYSIARSYGLNADDLMRHNGITDPGRLRAGQQIRIPGDIRAAGNSPAVDPPPVITGAGGAASYRVLRGDTLFGIARNFSVTVEAIRRENNLPESYVLLEGDILRIPSGTAAASQPSPPVQTAGSEAGTGSPSVIWPVAARELSYMTGKLSGVLITGARAESVKSLIRGTVVSAGPFQGFGRVAIVQVDGGYLYVYGGCESLSVKEGDRVGPGTEIGKLGVDAKSNKPQLFFMVYQSNTPIDPAIAPRA